MLAIRNGHKSPEEFCLEKADGSLICKRKKI